MAADMLPALRRFGAELIIISAGFDAHHMDPLGGLNFTDDDYHWITRELMKVADESASGRVVSSKVVTASKRWPPARRRISERSWADSRSAHLFADMRLAAIRGCARANPIAGF